ncbi:MAG TPA: carboxypeptidase-like regulatory domain-containing protein, partial [Armatimonadota bacterium]|nr:carboxypeptidase-like regulatory domain-containing protein [Armatimonadota bacterium]
MRAGWLAVAAVLLGMCGAGLAVADEHLVAGRVLGPDGAAVADATIWLTTTDWDDMRGPLLVAEQRTDAEGHFRFGDLPDPPARPGTFSLCVHKEGLAFAWAGRLHGNAPDLLLVLERPVQIRGRVLDPEGGPVTGVRPQVSWLTRGPGFDPLDIVDMGQAYFGPPPEVAEVIATETDAEGWFEVLDMPPGLALHASVRVPGYAPAYVQAPWRDLGAGTPLQLVLQTPGAVRGRVYRGHDGRPMPGVSVMCGYVTATTDERGYYEATGLAPGAWDVHLHELPRVFTARAVPDVVVEPGATVEGVDLVAAAGVEISGRVTERDTGRPVPGVGICCNTQQQPSVGRSWPLLFTDDRGCYRLRAPEGAAELRPFEMPRGWRPAGTESQQLR